MELYPIGAIVMLPEANHLRIAKVIGHHKDMVRVEQDMTGEDDMIFFFREDLYRIA
jgi:hypothetical protein